MQGGVDNEGNVNMRVNQAWGENSVTKAQAQVCVSHSSATAIS